MKLVICCKIINCQIHFKTKNKSKIYCFSLYPVTFHCAHWYLSDLRKLNTSFPIYIAEDNGYQVFSALGSSGLHSRTGNDLRFYQGLKYSNFSNVQCNFPKSRLGRRKQWTLITAHNVSDNNILGYGFYFFYL